MLRIPKGNKILFMVVVVETVAIMSGILSFLFNPREDVSVPSHPTISAEPPIPAPGVPEVFIVPSQEEATKVVCQRGALEAEYYYDAYKRLDDAATAAFLAHDELSRQKILMDGQERAQKLYGEWIRQLGSEEPYACRKLCLEMRAERAARRRPATSP